MENLQVKKKNQSISGAEFRVLWSINSVSSTVPTMRSCVCMLEIGNRIKREIEEHEKSGRSLTPVEEVDIGVKVRCDEALVLQSQAKISQLRITLVINRISGKAGICQLSEIILHTTELCNNKPEKHGVKIDSQLKTQHNASHQNIKEIGDDQYRIPFTPTLCERYKIYTLN